MKKVILVTLILIISLASIQCTVPEVRTYEGILTDIDIGNYAMCFTFQDGKVITVTGNPPPELQLGKVYIITYHYTGTLPGDLISIECVNCEEASVTDTDCQAS